MVTGLRGVRFALFDINYWKSFVHARLAVLMGDSGCLSLFGHKPERHRLPADHPTSEYRGQARSTKHSSAVCVPSALESRQPCTIHRSISEQMIRQ